METFTIPDRETAGAYPRQMAVWLSYVRQEAARAEYIMELMETDRVAAAGEFERFRPSSNVGPRIT